MTAVLAAAVAAIGFAAAGLLGLLGGSMGARGRPVFVAVAGGVLLALAFADLFPEALRLAGPVVVWGFVGGFALLLVTEAATRSHTYHPTGQRPSPHATAPFLLGLAVHNLADGFTLGVSAELQTAIAGAVALGIVVHQIPTGLSLAAMLAAGDLSRRQRVRAVFVLAAAIPVAAAVTALIPIAGERASGVLLGVAAGVLTYISASHLLPETQHETRAALPAAVFVATLGVMTLALRTILGG